MKNIQPTVDDKPPVLNPVLLYNTGFMENNAARQMQIDEENFKLLQRINIIYRTKVKSENIYKILYHTGRVVSQVR